MSENLSVDLNVDVNKFKYVEIFRSALRCVVTPITLFYIAVLILIFIPGKRETDSPIAFITVSTAVWLYFIYKTIRHKGKKNVRDITYGIYVLLIIWEVTTRVTNVVPKVLFPSPENTFNVFIIERELMLKGLGSSLFLLATGFSIALLLGNLLGLFVGWNDRLREDFYPVAKVLSPIPPMIYTPYLIAVTPTFTIASISVIAFGLFWPTFMGMINRVALMDRKIIDSAKVMDVSTYTMLLKVILPYSIPSIVGGLRVQLSTTFMILVMAEMIGAQSGLGFFVKKYSDYADYTRVVAGIIFIGIVITLLNYLITLVENRVVKWK